MIDTKLLDLAVQDLRNVLRDGLVATDIWDRIDGLSLAGFNQQPVAVALFTRITTELESSLVALHRESRVAALQLRFRQRQHNLHTGLDSLRRGRVLALQIDVDRRLV